MISATRENARSIQRLTLQDARRAGFTNPFEKGDPRSHKMVIDQQLRLADHPERYYGYFNTEGELVGFAKRAEWLVGDELPFIEGSKRVVFRLRQKVRMHRTGQIGVFGLVVSEEITPTTQRLILTNLLAHALNGPRGEEPVVNIIIYEGDPVMDIAERLGFRRFGKVGEAAGAPGLLQWCYRRSITVT